MKKIGFFETQKIVFLGGLQKLVLWSAPWGKKTDVSSNYIYPGIPNPSILYVKQPWTRSKTRKPKVEDPSWMDF